MLWLMHVFGCFLWSIGGAVTLFVPVLLAQCGKNKSQSSKESSTEKQSSARSHNDSQRQNLGEERAKGSQGGEEKTLAEKWSLDKRSVKKDESNIVTDLDLVNEDNPLGRKCGQSNPSNYHISDSQPKGKNLHTVKTTTKSVKDTVVEQQQGPSGLATRRKGKRGTVSEDKHSHEDQPDQFPLARTQTASADNDRSEHRSHRSRRGNSRTRNSDLVTARSGAFPATSNARTAHSTFPAISVCPTVQNQTADE